VEQRLTVQLDRIEFQMGSQERRIATLEDRSNQIGFGISHGAMKNITEQHKNDLAYEPVSLAYENELKMARLLIETIKQMSVGPAQNDLPVIA
jgi:ATP-dependent RNA circularization protein (DNA/RNA ligase family)